MQDTQNDTKFMAREQIIENIMYKKIHIKYFVNIAESKYLRDNQTQNKVVIPPA
jgi:hypothetical protein